MRLSNLYTEELIGEAWDDPIKNLIGRVFKRNRTTPRLKKQRIENIIDKVYEDVWKDYLDDDKAVARMRAFKASMKVLFMPEFLTYKDEKSLRQYIEVLFRDRAQRKIGKRARQMIGDDPKLSQIST